MKRTLTLIHFAGRTTQGLPLCGAPDIGDCTSTSEWSLVTCGPCITKATGKP